MSDAVTWYRRVARWAQTNLREVDPPTFDLAFWVDYWRRTRVGGVIVNAGGIVAYYPTEVPHHRPARFLGGRDLFGEICRAAKDEGLAVVARLDSNAADQRFYYEHPDWFAHDRDGVPYRNAIGYFVACVNGPYYHEHIPRIMREVHARYPVDGWFDNSWSGLARTQGICSCANCRRRFRADTGQELPHARDWEDPAFRRWIEWRYARRLALWELNNRTAREAGGPECLWLGNNSYVLASQCAAARDWLAQAERTPFFFLDFQVRRGQRLWAAGEAGKLVQSVLPGGPVADSIAQYNLGQPVFRLTQRPPAEVRLWFAGLVAGGIRPWWHVIGAASRPEHGEDRRKFATAGELFPWHAENERYLLDRTPVANVGIVWSQRNVDFHGRDEPQERVQVFHDGLADALVRARIPYGLVHADRLDEASLRPYRLLVLPNLACLSDHQCDQLRAFVRAGGGLVATWETSLRDEWGDAREDFGLADLFGAGWGGRAVDAGENSYLRIVERQPPLEPWRDTDLLPLGGALVVTTPRVGAGAARPLVFVPAFPAFPPEFSWPEVERTALPGLYLCDRPLGPGSGRVAYLPADLDRSFWRWGQPDHGELLAGLVGWALDAPLPVEVDGSGIVDVHLWRQGAHGRTILHLVNLTNPAYDRPPAHELIPVGPQRVRLPLGGGAAPHEARLLVAGGSVPAVPDGDAIVFEVPSILDHEVVVVEADGPGSVRARAAPAGAQNESVRQ
ncbi:MAG TPA: alpha-amylase family protein [Chloroflexota bacterium]|nr:alpha-amylase family protein [Chloroflexota bacterium]